MIDYKNVLATSISYSRNIKDMPFVKTLTDMELAIGVTRSMSEIYGDDIEFKSLKNLDMSDCNLLQEKEIITTKLIDNKDIASYGIALDEKTLIYVNEEDHVKLICKDKGFKLEEIYNKINALDDKLLDKLEISFNTKYGYLLQNPYNCGTGMFIECVLFIPALVKSGKLEKIKKELLKDEFEIVDYYNKQEQLICPIVKLKNKYTFGYKEKQFAEKITSIVNKILELENLEETNLFEMSSSGLVDSIFRDYGIAKNAYRMSFEESVCLLGNILWGINLKILKSKNKFDILQILCNIKDNHISNKIALSVKEIEKQRAKKFLIFYKM